MNKKFTFMVAALLAAGSFSINAQTAATGALSQDTYYLIGDGSNGYLKAETVKVTATGHEFTTLSTVGLPSDFSTSSAEDVNKSLWKVEIVKKNGKIDSYKLINKHTGAYLTMNEHGFAYPGQSADPSIVNFSWFVDSDSNGKIEGTELTNGASLNTNENKGITLAASQATSLSTSPSTLKLYTIDAFDNQEKIIEALNLTMGGNGFSLIPSDDDVTVEDDNNIFSRQIKAINLTEATDAVSGETIPAGVYMLVSAPDKFEEKYSAATLASDKIALFNECEFVAVSASENYGTSEVSQNGLEFVVVSGAELNKYSQASDSDKKTSDTEIWVNNAVFNIVEPNQYVNPGSYTFHIANARIIDSSKTDKSHKNVTNLNVGVTTIQNVNYVTTTATATEFKAGSTSLVKAIDLLKEEKAPSVFNIQFLSNEDTENSEYGKHLGVAYTGSDLGFVAQGDALVDLSLPQYQFVISAIDTKTQEVTFTNIETKESFKTKLYSVEGETNVYKAVEANGSVSIAEDDAEGLNQYASATSMGGMIIKLSPVTVDSYAGFVKEELNNNTPYRLVFAKNENSSEKLYVALDEDYPTDKNTILSEEESIQVVLEPETSNDKIKENKISVAYAYSKDDKYYTASEDMVKYYTYKLRIVDSEASDYLTTARTNSYKLSVVNSKEEAEDYVIKYRNDGSVAIAISLSGTSSRLDVSSDSKYAVLGTGMYSVPESNEMSLYLEEEKLGVSLDAKSQHVSLESENGGFLSINDVNEGVVAIRTEAAEDLTFWLDTTNSESYIPSFYISKGGKFMYNSKDSLDVNTTIAKAKYGLGEDGSKPKAIFRDATLVNSDTLKTVVDGKEVLVASKANQNKGILDGVEDFQYNIVKASADEDNYVIRSVGKANTYLANFNGVLGFITNKANAMRVIVETQAAPTSNESVSASEVKVVANNGSVVVKNAAGKNVVVSTILGQVVANEVLTSDNATINVPAGIVVVAVEGESFKVNVK